MGNALCLVINLAGKDIKFTEWKGRYVEQLRQGTWEPFNEKTIGAGKHYAFSASKFEKRWRRRQNLANLYTEWRVSLRSEDVEGVPLSLRELEGNIAFVFEMGFNNELVKLTVSREEAKRRGIKKGFFGNLKKMQRQLIPLAWRTERKTASSSVRQNENM